MARLRPVLLAFVTLGTLLLLSACGTSVPSAVGSYKVTFVYTPTSVEAKDSIVGNGNGSYSLELGADGHFVLKPVGNPHGTFKGMWAQTNDRVTLVTAKFDLVAMLKRKNLRQGHIDYLRGHPPVGYTLPWYAVRT